MICPMDKGKQELASAKILEVGSLLHRLRKRYGWMMVEVMVIWGSMSEKRKLLCCLYYDEATKVVGESRKKGVTGWEGGEPPCVYMYQCSGCSETGVGDLARF